MKTTFLLALYGGPDQLMPITSGLTAMFAFLLIFWNKVLIVLCRMLNLFRRRKPEDKPIAGQILQALPTSPASESPGLPLAEERQQDSC